MAKRVSAYMHTKREKNHLMLTNVTTIPPKNIHSKIEKKKTGKRRTNENEQQARIERSREKKCCVQQQQIILIAHLHTLANVRERTIQSNSTSEWTRFFQANSNVRTNTITSKLWTRANLANANRRRIERKVTKPNVDDQNATTHITTGRAKEKNSRSMKLNATGIYYTLHEHLSKKMLEEKQCERASLKWAFRVWPSCACTNSFAKKIPSREL